MYSQKLQTSLHYLRPVNLFLYAMCSKGKWDECGGRTRKHASFIKICLHIPFLPTLIIRSKMSFLTISCFPLSISLLSFLTLLPSFNLCSLNVHPPLPVDNWGSRVCSVRMCEFLPVCVCVTGNEPGLRGRGASKTE